MRTRRDPQPRQFSTKATTSSNQALPRRLLSVHNVALRLNLAERTVRLWCEQGRLPGFKLGTVWRFDPEDIDAHVRSRRAAIGE